MTDLSAVARSILLAPYEHKPYSVSHSEADGTLWYLERKGVAIGKLYDDGTYPTPEDIARMLNEAEERP